MASLASIRNKLETKVFDKIGTLVALETWSSATTDKWGDDTPAYAASTNVTAVPYNYITDRRDYQPFGNLEEGEVIMVFKYDQTIDMKDRITYKSEQYLITEIEDYQYSGGSVAKLARMSQVQ